MKRSARNVLEGKAAGIARGCVASVVRIDLDGGAIATSSIAEAAADDLNAAIGDGAFAVVRASDVPAGGS